MRDLIQMENEFIKIQNEYKNRIINSDTFSKDSIRTIAGVDLAYWKNNQNEEYAVCCIVVIDYKSHSIIEKKSYKGKIEVPYMPGFLAFRELPLVLKTAELLESKPDIFMFDGNGYLHPRHMGIATHASFYLKTPTIGVAKTYFRADKKTDYTEPDTESGSYTDIIINKEIYGRVLRTHDNIKPVFISTGNFISLETATEITMLLVNRESRIPIPTRLADIETHAERKEAT